jgi:hypothetical protein
MLLAAVSVHAAPLRVAFVDNRAAAGGVGTAEHPIATINDALRFGEIIFVAETDQPYRESVTLRRGQMLIGSAYGLDAVRSELHAEFDAPPTPAAQGPGPLIQGSVILTGDNVVAGVIIATAAPAALSTTSPSGPISVLATYIRTSRAAIALSINSNDFPVTFTGGGLTAAGGGGVMLYGGMAPVTFDRFAIDGTFTSALDIRGRLGATIFRGRAAIDVADATQPAVTIADCTGRVAIEVPLRVTAHARGVSISKSTVKIRGDASRIATTNAPALEIRDAAVDAAFEAVSANSGDRGVIVDKLRGTLAITGGAIANVRVHGIEVTQSSGVRLSNITLTDAGGGDRVKCDDEVESKTNLRCGAALYLRHVSHSELENIIVTGGKQIGLNANNIEDVTFGGLQIRGVSDEAVVVDEAKGTVKFNRCAFESSVVVAQQYNSAKIVFDRCTFSGVARPTATAYLAAFRTSGIGKLDLELRNIELHDNAGSGLHAEGAGSSTLNMLVMDSRFERLGFQGIGLELRDQAHSAFTLRGTTIYLPGNDGSPAVDVTASGAAVACADFIGNQLVTASAARGLRLSPAVTQCH